MNKKITVNEMQENVIRCLGFENKKTVKFFEICECGDAARIYSAYTKIMK